MICEIIESWLTLGKECRFPGSCLLLSLPLLLHYYSTNNVQQMFYHLWDGRVGFLEAEFSSCLLFFAANYGCTAARKSSLIYIADM